MLQTKPSSIELLAPARDADTAIAAIAHGADAVYIGASSHGARAAAANSVADVARVCEFAHRFGASVYVTLNTLIYPSELKQVERLVWELYRVGVDALIVQDLAFLRMDLPPIALHASTQCDIRTPAKALWLQELGMSRLVLPRELTLEEIAEIRAATAVELEAFIHGALCVSFSGKCYASEQCGGRSANRGECAQICRLPYDLVDGRGRILVKDKHLLSLKDLNRLPDLDKLIDVGVMSLKIEGRLKDAAYVKNVVSAYDRRLRQLGVARTSLGDVERQFAPDVAKSFNRGFTQHFLFDPRAAGVSAMESPKSLGVEVGKVSRIRGNRVELCRPARLANGDGLNFTDSKGKTIGMRVNRFEPPATIICPGSAPGELRPGMILRRNGDKQFADLLLRTDSAERRIMLNLTLRRAGEQLVLENEGGASAAIPFPQGEAARSPQLEARQRVIGKLGDTQFALAELRDLLGEEFIPASVLTSLRRLLVEALQAQIACEHSRPLRRKENPKATFTVADNVANPLAAQVYADHGVTEIVSEPEAAMTMRYCLRRELGRCLLTPAGREWPEPLTLLGAPKPLRLHFDCARCQMQVHSCF